MEEIVTNGWNDIKKYAPPLNKEIFILTEDDLNPFVAICRMAPANKLTWTVNKEGMVLCYDVPCGGFHSCNGSKIRYWKEIDRPYVKGRPEQDKIQSAVETLLKLPVKERYSLLFGTVKEPDVADADEHEAYLKCKDTVRQAVHDYIKTVGHDLTDAEKMSISHISEFALNA